MLKNTLALLAGLVLSGSAFLAQATETLRVSAIPDEAPTELLRKFEPLGAYLEQQLGMKVQFVPVADYPAVVEALATDRLDMAWLGGFTFVQARLKTDATTPADATVDAKLTFQDGQVAGQKTQAIKADDAGTTNIEFSNTNAWPAGKYKVDVTLNGQPVGMTQEIEVK